jgi:nucleoside phosphorylase/SpoVK/Ycf46/Vps4 family AAA+-type ATPase
MGNRLDPDQGSAGVYVNRQLSGNMSHYRTAEQVKIELSAKPRRALVITTVKHEGRAVQSHLSSLENVTGSNNTIYQFGTFSDPAGDWAVIHAICQQGNADAGVTIAGAYKDFGTFDAQIFVGVAGSLKDDLPIGSVVVGNYVYNAHSAKVDDKGRYSRPHALPSAHELLQAATMLILDDSWINLIKAPFRMTLPAVEKYPCPYPPKAEIKAIASGEQVVAGGKSRTYQDIRKFLNDAGAVEMEGFGAMSAARMERTPAILVRGISDMCAGKDHVADSQYQPIASAHAAAFAFSILSMRSRASPLGPGGAELQARDGEQVPPKAPNPRVDFVVNFNGTSSEWSEQSIESVIEGLRKLTGDQELTLVRIDKGSVRLVVSVQEKDISTLTLEAVRTAAGNAGPQLLGAITAQELTKAEEARAALERASADLLSWEKTLPGGGWLERPEKRDIESRFHSEFSSTVVLGEPGSGKSALLAAIATDLIKVKAPLLAIKADFVSTAVRSEKDLQADLHLPALPSEIIEQLARLQPVFLFIDQLDALASQLDLQSDRLNVLLNLVRRVGGLPNVHIVLSARTFEFNHDVRLRGTNAEAVTLALPPWQEVAEKLSAAGIDTETWPENAREVVRNPQSLKTYLMLDRANAEQPYSKYQSMLERLWRQKIANAPDSEALASLASDLAGIMAEEEALWVAASRFDARARALERLESVGLIVRSDNGKSIAFSHQTVFDYVLARSFVRTAGRLSSYVLERQDSLFVRAKLWSALRYLRDAEIVSYQREFLEIWRHENLRHHLRLLLIEFLGEVHNPEAFEVVCLAEVMQLDKLRIAGLKSIIGNPDWFGKFARSAIPAAMTAGDIEANQALRILQKEWTFSADEVVRLLRERWLSTPIKDGFTWSALDTCTTWTDAVEEIAHTILSRTPISTFQIDYTASMVTVEQPEVALRLIRAKLEFLLKEARATPPGKPFPEDGAQEERLSWNITDEPTKPFVSILESMEWSSLPAMAEASPQKFLEVLWPWFREVFNELRVRRQNEVRDYAFPGLYSVDIGLGDETSDRLAREYPILSSLRLAVEGTAAKDSAYFSSWAQANSDLEFMAPQTLIAHGFSWAPEAYAELAFDWLFDDLRRLQLGNPYGSRQITAALIDAVSPYWTDEQVRDFESRIQQYGPTTPAYITEPKDRMYFSQSIRETKAHLLAAIPTDRLSEKSRALIITEKRALGDDLDHGMRLTGSGFIGSPMEAGAMAKAKDRDILKILKEVPDNTDWDHPTSWMRGGNIQLSRAFAEFAKVDPARAIRLMEQFEPNGQERAAGYALDSMAESGNHDRELQDALLDLHRRGFSADEFRYSASHAVEKIANRSTQIDPAVIEVLTEWLSSPRERVETSDKKDVSEIIEEDEPEDAKDSREDSILWGHGGISVLPGGNFPILSALTSILLKNKEEGRDRLIAILNDHLPRERNPKVWQALLMRLAHAGGSTPEVVSKFLRALFVTYPALLETREAVYFLAYAQRWDEGLVFDLIAPWERSDKPMLRHAQGELVGLIATVRGSDRWTNLREHLLEHGSPEARIGLAYAGAHLWNETQFHTSAGSLLERLIPGADKIRMSAILDVFRICADLVPEPTTLAFLQALAAPEIDLVGAPSTFMVEKLQSLLPNAADVIGNIALKLIEAWRAELSDVRTATAMDAPQLMDLAITLHRLGGVSRKTGVTVFEALIDLDAYGARDTLVEIDGRFGIHPTGARRRIARRAAKRANRRSA